MQPEKTSRYRHWWAWLGRLSSSAEGVQIVELAVTLPLVTAMFVATYDFGQAFNVKQKVVAAAREGARFAANQSTSDLTTGTASSCPSSICAIRDVVHAYLVNSNISDCGLASALVARGGATQWTWTFTASGCAGGNLVLTINRANTYTTTVPSGAGNVTMTVQSTKVTLAYPYQWHINRIMQMLGGSYGATTTITANSVMENMN